MKLKLFYFAYFTFMGIMLVIPLKTTYAMDDAGPVYSCYSGCWIECDGAAGGTHLKGSKTNPCSCSTSAPIIWDECYTKLEGICVERGKHNEDPGCYPLAETYTPLYQSKCTPWPP